MERKRKTGRNAAIAVVVCSILSAIVSLAEGRGLFSGLLSPSCLESVFHSEVETSGG